MINLLTPDFYRYIFSPIKRRQKICDPYLNRMESRSYHHEPDWELGVDGEGDQHMTITQFKTFCDFMDSSHNKPIGWHWDRTPIWIKEGLVDKETIK
jgi:hypothetical protein